MDVKIPQAIGHCYLELVEKDDEGRQTIAKMRAVLWQQNAHRELSKFYATTGFPFRSGLKVLVRGRLSFHEVYGLSFVITAIDGTYTVGDIARKRKEIVNRLKREGILELNRKLELPVPTKRIAVISSRSAAGWGDFEDHLLQNRYGFPFYCSLFPATMQGDNAPSSIRQALDKIRSQSSSFDAVVIIRGGGAESNLQELESYELAASIATFPLPILTGIGHHKDENILDLVAHKALKTPTAVADYLISCRLEELSQLEMLEEKLYSLLTQCVNQEKTRLTNFVLQLPIWVGKRLQGEKELLVSMKHRLESSSTKRLAEAHQTLTQQLFAFRPAIKLQLLQAEKEIDSKLLLLKQLVRNTIKEAQSQLAYSEQMLQLLHPDKVLQRGYALVRLRDRIVTSLNQIERGDTISVRLSNGAFDASVEQLYPTSQQPQQTDSKS